MIFLGPKIIKGSPEKLLSYYFIEFFNFLHWPKSGPDKFIILENLLIYRVLIKEFLLYLRKGLTHSFNQKIEHFTQRN